MHVTARPSASCPARVSTQVRSTRSGTGPGCTSEPSKVAVTAEGKYWASRQFTKTTIWYTMTARDYQHKEEVVSTSKTLGLVVRVSRVAGREGERFQSPRDQVREATRAAE